MIAKVLLIAGHISRHISWDLRGYFFRDINKFLYVYSTFSDSTSKQCPAETTWETLLMTIQAKACTILVCKYEVQQTIPPLV
jgi:hypothetical protein